MFLWFVEILSEEMLLLLGLLLEELGSESLEKRICGLRRGIVGLIRWWASARTGETGGLVVVGLLLVVVAMVVRRHWKVE